MEVDSTLEYVIGEEQAMKGRLISHVPALLEKKGWNGRMLAGHMMIRGSSPDTAYRLARGETNFNMETILVVAEILGCKSISELIEFEWNESNQG